MSVEGNISAKIGTERKQKLKMLADASFNGSLTAALIAAVDAFLEGQAEAENSLPIGMREKIEFLHLLVQEGSKEDWPLLEKGVEDLWKGLPLSK